MKGWPIKLFLLLACGAFTTAQEPEIDESQLPRIPATEPEDVLKTFEIHPDFILKLVAHEPDIVDPIAMAFDADGGMYVIEMRGYSERREEALGRIRYLRDKDNDGLFETSVVFKDGLKWPTGLVCYKGGLFVGASPDLFYFKDTDGDFVSDEERVVLTGFGEGKPELNMQALFNSFHWGPNNRIWGATAANGGTVTRPGDPSFGEISIRGADFSFDPETLDFRRENGTAQYGMSFDSMGRRFVCSNSAHAIWVAYEQRHVLPNPYYDLPRALINIPDDGAAAPVFRISPDEPWRIVRTRWRVSGVVRGMIEGGGRVSGYFTSATGIHMYWGDAFGQDYKNNIFVGDVGSNLVHRKTLVNSPTSVQPIATRSSDELDTEFLRSSDNWFRPASFATGPDGCLYICDMYREVIEHPWSLPPGIKKHLDLNSGFDRGRIYRVEPVGFERPDIPKLSSATDERLLALATTSTVDWKQTTARRLLFERGQSLPTKAPTSPFPAMLNSPTSLVEKLEEWKGDSWMESAVLNSLRNEQAIQEAWEHPASGGSNRFERQLANIAGRTRSLDLIGQISKSLAKRSLSTHVVDLVLALQEGVQYADGSWSEIEHLEGLNRLFEKAKVLLEGPQEEEEAVVSALQLLRIQQSRSNEDLIKRLVSSKETSERLLNEAIQGIKDSTFLIHWYTRLPQQARFHATNTVLQEREATLELLAAIADNLIPFDQLAPETLQQLREYSDSDISKKAREILPKMEERSEVIERYQSSLSGIGDPEAGKMVFQKACISCHQTPDDEGYSFGPPITSFKTAGSVSLLGNILDPNKEVAPQYQAFTFELQDGRIMQAMIASEGTRNVTLQLPGGLQETFPRTQVKSMTGLGFSLMPEGLEQLINEEEMKDLLAYLSQ